MINKKECQEKAKILASKVTLSKHELDVFYKEFDSITTEYKNKYQLYSTSIDLKKIVSFDNWLSKINIQKEQLAPIIADKIVNEVNLYFLSLYQHLFADTDLIPNDVNEMHSEGDLAILTGCHYVENYSDIVS